MPNKKSLEVAEQLVNLTGKTIFLYDDASGEIKEFLPDNKMADPTLDLYGHPRLYYVVSETLLEKLRMMERMLDDVAFVFGTGTGRENATVSYLRSAKDAEIVIRYRRPSGFYAA